MEGRTELRRLWRAYLAPHRREAIVLVVVLLAATTLPLLGPQLLRRFVDEAAAGAPTSTLARLALGYLVVALAAQVGLVYASWSAGRLAWRSTNELREDLARHVLHLDMGFHGEHTAGELIDRVDGDVSKLAEFLSRFVLQLVGSGMLLLGVVVIVFVEDARLGAALLAFLTVASVVVVRLQRVAVPRAVASRDAMARKFGNLEERLAAAEDLRTLGAGAHAVNRFHESCREEFGIHRAYNVVSGATITATTLVFAGGTALMLGMGVVLHDSGALSLGSLVMLFQYTTMIRRPVEQVVGQSRELQDAAAGAARVRELLGIRSSLPPPRDTCALAERGPLDVTFAHVTFAYGTDRPILHDVSLHIPAGHRLGLVGRTGSGKSTMARLLLRLYDPVEGSVLVGGHDLRDVATPSLRHRVRAVTQDVQVFSADVRDNMTLFSGELDDGQLEAVAEDVGLGPWLRHLPHGLDTRLGPGGSGLSAGEAQLLALARVFLADPGVVILDEPSSRLDPATDRLVMGAIDRVLAGRTGIVIAHRLSSLDHVDDIAVIEGGRIVEHGRRVDLAADPSTRFAHLLTLTGTAAQ